jgi:hypothetical protein
LDFATSVGRFGSNRIEEDSPNRGDSVSRGTAADLAASIESDFLALVQTLGRAAAFYGTTAQGMSAGLALAAATQGLSLAGRLIEATAASDGSSGN